MLWNVVEWRDLLMGPNGTGLDSGEGMKGAGGGVRVSGKFRVRAGSCEDNMSDYIAIVYRDYIMRRNIYR